MADKKNLSRAIFLDKDGVIVDNSGYPSPPRATLLPDAEDGLRLLAGSTYKTVVISNQSWIGKGVLSKDDVESIFIELARTITSFGVSLDGWYYCPHREDEGCMCRKPSPYLFLKAAREHGINLSQSYVIGDMTSDILAGRKAGATTILVQTGLRGMDKRYDAIPDLTFQTFSKAIRFILTKERENA